jgi:hypothetical protein
MKIINDWPSLNKLNIPAADPPVLANSGSLYYSFYHYHYESMSVGLWVYLPFAYSREVAWFYYRMEEFGIYGFLNRG